jgi:hypothetical protein
MNKTWKAILGVILIFILGWLTGALCGSLYVRHRVLDIVQRGPEAVAGILEQRMTRNLDLDATQKDQIHGFILANLQQRKLLQAQVQPQVQVANRETLKEINSVLRPDQQQKLHENLVEFRQRFGKSPFNPNADVPTDGTATPANPAPANPAPTDITPTNSAPADTAPATTH